jgi:hypothetical protein
VFAVVSTAVVTTATLLYLLKAGPHNIYVYAGVPPAVGIMWLAAMLAALFIGWIILAPAKQRDEARLVVREYLCRDLVIEKAYLIDGSRVRLLVTNEGATDAFVAQMIGLAGVDGEWKDQPPRTLRWEGVEGASHQIMHDAKAVLEVCSVFDPKYHANMPEGRRVDPATICIDPVGQEQRVWLRTAHKEGWMFDDAMRQLFRIHVRITSGSMKAPSDAIVELTFPSPRKSHAGGPNDEESRRADVRAALVSADEDSSL